MLLKMLVRRLTRSLWNTVRVEKRLLATEPLKPLAEEKEGVDPIQVSINMYH